MTSRSPAVIFSDNNPSRSNGGEELVLRETLLGLAARRWPCLLAYHEWGDLVPEYEAAGIECRRFDLAPVRPKFPGRFASSVAAQALWARRAGVQLLHCNSFNRAAHAAIIKRLGGFPAICHLHVSPPEYLSRQYRWGLRQLEGFFAVSDCAAEQWSKTLRIPRERIAVLYNPVDTDRFRPDEKARELARRELGIADDCVVLGYCGRVIQQKGVDVLLRAMAKLASDHRAMKFLVIGGDAQNVALCGERLEPRLRALARELGVAERVSFLGIRHDVERWYNAMDIVVAPSVSSEGFGLVVAEALACGRPAVASRIGGIPEILSGPLRELLVPPNDDEALAAVLRRLVDDPRRREQLGKLGREIVERKFGLALYLDRFEHLLHGMLQ